MISQLNLQGLRAACVASALLVSPLVNATEDTGPVTQNQRVVDSLIMLGGQFSAAITPDMGFPPEYIEHWQSAVEVAFAPDLIAADVDAALETALTAEARAAALAYDQSPLGRDVLEVMAQAEPLKADPDHLAATRDYLDKASPEDRALLADLFTAQGADEQTDIVMTIYFEALRIAAEPVIGAEVAAQWIESAAPLREVYAQDHLLSHAAIFRLLPKAQLQELVIVAQAPDMTAFAAQTNAAFREALQSAADRLEAAYVRELDR